jgi:hypothetical protein
MRVAVAQLALFKAREEHGIRRPVVFSRSIVQSEAFAETLPETAAAIPGCWATLKMPTVAALKMPMSEDVIAPLGWSQRGGGRRGAGLVGKVSEGSVEDFGDR